MSKCILDGLNPQQRDVILHEGGPLLVLAGAGSGKTKAITHRFAYIAKKHSTDSMLAVTFTNKAAEEMKERIACLTGKSLCGSWVGTFHSQCNRILRREIGILGYGSDFTIYDEDDQCTLIRHILKEFKIYEALYRGILSRISSLKAASITPEEFLSGSEGFGFEERLAKVYIKYQDELKKCNAVDFDDLIMLCIRIFEKYPEVLKKYSQIFRHILVDEFQDTNAAQYRLIKLLAGSNGNLCVVGDDDQSIYGFRGANIGNILEFERDFPGTKVIRLEQNYRSTKNILNVSENVIKGNSRRREKTLWSERDEGEKVCHCWFDGEEDEARCIAKLIKELYLKGLHDYRDFALLYRVNLQSRPLEEALRQERLPYRVLGGMSFYQRKEIKDMTAYMKLALNNNDNVSLRRVINTPPRGIGASTIAKIEAESKKKSISLYAALLNLAKGGLTATTKDKLSSFAGIIEGLSVEKFKSAADMLRAALDKSGYAGFADEDRAENIAELIASAGGKSPAEFIDVLSLYNGHDGDCQDNAVSLLTLHNAKGLQFPVVFITGLEDGLLPYFKAKSRKEVEEERRLLYVGITRAKDMLWFTGAGRRRLYSKVLDQEPSRFLKDLPEGCVKVHRTTRAAPASQPERRRFVIRPVAMAYAVGSKVKHPKWGVGIVRDCYGDGEDQKITVNFPEIGLKRLALRFANIERI